MAVTSARCRTFALSLDGAVEAPHFDYASFRVGGRIFATMPPDGAHLHVFLPEEARAPVLALHADAVEKLWWGKQVVGLRVTLAKATAALVEPLLRQAWEVRTVKAEKPRPPSAVRHPPSSAAVQPRDTTDEERRTAVEKKKPAKYDPDAAIYFPSPKDFRAWLKKNGARTDELLVGFHKVDSGVPSLTWPQSVDEALCFGWIDGVRRSVDATRYTIRFTPRRAGSHWSNINVARVQALTAEGRMQPAGLAAFAARDAAKTGRASYERGETPEFPPDLLDAFKARKAAWTFFTAQPPGYRRLMTSWVVAAKQDATRRRRLDALAAASAAGERMR